MSRHFWRACRRENGVTLMELLVAIIIAAVFFAAATPLFVQAITVGSGDRMRSIAMNAAQDRIEKLHQIDYDSVTVPKLQDPTFYPVDVNGTQKGFFGPTWVMATASGNVTLNVGYNVDTQAATTTSAQYKLVTITVSWKKPEGTKTESLVLKTIVYRQFAGPQITLFTLDPTPTNMTINGHALDSVINAATVTLEVTINNGNIPAMRPVVVGGTTLKGFVKFTVTSASGASTTLPLVYYDSARESTYSTTWTVPGGAGIGDGFYKFTAVAYTSTKVPGNTWTVTGLVESGAPAPATDLAAIGAKDVNGVALTWTGSASADLDHYVLSRSGGTGTFDPVTLPAGSSGYSDATAVANTTYTYSLAAYDKVDNTGTASTAQVVWYDPSTPPGPISNLKAIQSSATDNHITLTWDPPAPTAGVTVAGYYVYAGGDTTTPVDTVTGTSDTNLTLPWGTSQYYQVKAYSTFATPANTWGTLATGQAYTVAAGANWARVAVAGEPLYTLNVTNNVAAKTWFTLWYRGVSGAENRVQVGSLYAKKAGNVVSFTGLHAGPSNTSYELTWGTSGVADGPVAGANLTVNISVPVTSPW